MATDSNGAEEFSNDLTEARGGCSRALGRLLGMCERLLLRHAYSQWPRNLRSKMGACDLVQETFVKALIHFLEFQGHTRAEFFGWLKVIHRNNLRDRRDDFRCLKREAARELRLDEAGEFSAASDKGPDSGEPEVKVHKAVADLAARYRQVMELHYLAGCPFVEIGRQLGSSANAAQKLCTRAKNQLAASLAY